MFKLTLLLYTHMVLSQNSEDYLLQQAQITHKESRELLKKSIYKTQTSIHNFQSYMGDNNRYNLSKELQDALDQLEEDERDLIDCWHKIQDREVK